MSTDVAKLLRDSGTTYAEEAGIRLRDTPAPLYRLLVLSTLLSARIGASVAVRTARELFDAGWTTPSRMRASTWQERVDALGRGGYRRYDESTATTLARSAELLRDDWRDDLRRLHRRAGDASATARLLRGFPGIGPTGASIFIREVQAVWPDLHPYVDALAAKGCERLGLPADATALAKRVPRPDFPRLVAACVRTALSRR